MIIKLPNSSQERNKVKWKVEIKNQQTCAAEMIFFFCPVLNLELHPVNSWWGPNLFWSVTQTSVSGVKTQIQFVQSHSFWTEAEMMFFG